ncbi:MAG: hypothetical protein QHJ73_11640, partial [Armatimonadota bacterium]|nr:hypothetical protein [Armatimonadota bacterium]
GGELLLEVYTQDIAGQWFRFSTIHNQVAPEPVDGYLVYRLLAPIYNQWSHLGLYQRHLATFREVPLVENDRLERKCINCHTFLNNQPQSFFFHTRSGDPAMVLVQDGSVSRVDTRTANVPRPATYAAWHPTGHYIAFSFNRIRQFFHTYGNEPRDVVDLDSGVAIFEVATRTLIRPTATTRADRLETFPTWSPDGRTLYYCSAPTPWAPTQWIPYQHVKKVRYDLVRAPFDPATRRLGTPQTLLAAARMGKSLLEPRVSPDGRFLLFTACDYGSFPIHQDHSDLFLLDLKAPGLGPRPLDPAPGTRRDSWHCWSSNGRWIVFSRKGENRVLARPYLRYIHRDGRAAKPFVVPQEDPRFYDRFVNTYNAPELVAGAVPIPAHRLARAVLTSPLEKATEATPPQQLAENAP